jgi:hypothetical protein
MKTGRGFSPELWNRPTKLCGPYMAEDSRADLHIPCRSPAATLPRPCHDPATTLPLPCHCPVTTLPLPCHYPVTTLPLPCHSPTVRTRASRPHVVFGWPMLIHTYHAAPLPRTYRGLERSLSERHIRSMAGERHCMCEPNTAALFKSNGKDTV